MAPSGETTDYSGRWTGELLVSSCGGSGPDVAATCATVKGNTARYQLILTQRGSEVTGTFAVGDDPPVSTAAALDPAGALVLTGTGVNDSGSTTVTWHLLLQRGALLGTFEMRAVPGDPSHGQMLVGGPIASATRTP